MYSTKNVAYLLTSLEAIEKLLIYTDGIDNPIDFLESQDQLIYNASLTLLMTIGEEVGKIEDELKSNYTDVPWQSIKGMRNRIAHDYRGLDPTIPFSVIKNYLQPLKVALIAMLNEIAYPSEKLEVILASPYYKHIRYLKFNDD